MSKNDGGTAFPESCTEGGYQANVSSGMSLRDYFAAKAMQGMLAAGANWSSMYAGSIDYLDDGRQVSHSPDVETAYRIADAMLAERNKKE